MVYLQPNPFFYGVARMLLVDHEVRRQIGVDNFAIEFGHPS